MSSKGCAVLCKALSAEGVGQWGEGKLLVAGSLLPLPLHVGCGLCFQHLPEGTTWTKPRGVWAELVKVLFCVGTLSTALPVSLGGDPGTDSLL